VIPCSIRPRAVCLGDSERGRTSQRSTARSPSIPALAIDPVLDDLPPDPARYLSRSLLRADDHAPALTRTISLKFGLVDVHEAAGSVHAGFVEDQR